MRARFYAVQLGVTVMMLLLGTASVRAEEADAPRVLADVVPPPTRWAAPALEVSLAASYATLQALDVFSTVTAVRSGRGQELNPMVGGLADRPAAFAAVKGAMTASTLFLMHRYAKHHPKAAVISMIALNIGYSYVVSQNLRIAAGR